MSNHRPSIDRSSECARVNHRPASDLLGHRRFLLILYKRTTLFSATIIILLSYIFSSEVDMKECSAYGLVMSQDDKHVYESTA